MAAVSSPSGHRHLALAASDTAAVPRWRRWLVVGLAGLAVVGFVLSLLRPWWTFVLYAPQYPRGLRLVIALTGVKSTCS